MAVLLHGILGSARNLRTFAGLLAERLPQWQLLLVDLRNHGDSHGAPGPHTVGACATDVLRLCADRGVAPAAVIGHSFGGKVAMELLRAPPQGLRQVWILDTQPHLRAGEEQSPAAVEGVLGALEAIPQPLADRQDVVALLIAQGMDVAVAQWMTTNLALAADGYRWRFDLPAIREMLADYFATDSWPVLEHPPPGIAVDVVRAARSERWTPEVLGRFERLRSREVRLHLLRDAGHWVHVDQPAALVDLISPSLARLVAQ